MKNYIQQWITIASAVCMLFLMVFPTSAQHLAIGVMGGTTGIGGEVVGKVHDRFNVRVGGTYFGYSMSHTIEDDKVDVGFDADMQVQTVSALVDYYPFKNGFHLSTGLMLNGIKAEGIGQPLNPYTFTLNNKERTLSTERMGSLSAEMQYGNDLVPYLGIGFGNAVKEGRRLGFLFELGALYTNSPQLNMTGTNMLEKTATQDKDLEAGLEDFKWFPSLNLGLTYKIMGR